MGLVVYEDGLGVDLWVVVYDGRGLGLYNVV